MVLRALRTLPNSGTNTITLPPPIAHTHKSLNQHHIYQIRAVRRRIMVKLFERVFVNLKFIVRRQAWT